MKPKIKKTETEMYKIVENGMERLCSVEEAEISRRILVTSVVS